MDLKRKLFIAGAAIVPVLGVGGLALASASGANPPSTSAPAPNTSAPGTSSPQSPDNSATSETTDAAEAPGTAQADGPGGHQDAAGVNVDHQFDGQE